MQCRDCGCAVTPELDEFGFEVVVCVACGAEYDTETTADLLEGYYLEQEYGYDE